jgi:large exoprotein involved in heme utilization and adhesion
VNASELVELRGGSSLSTVTQYTGDAGNLRIETKQLIVQDGSQISASTFNRGRGGTLSVTADSIQLVGVSPQGKPSGLFNVTETESTGDAGNIAIKTGRLIVQDGAQISASTLSRGQGGTLSITADSIQLVGISPQGKPSGLFNVTESTGDAGNIAIKTGRLIVQDGAQISASTRNGGQGGTLSVTADSIQLGGTSSQGIPSGLFVRSIAAGDAGNLEIEAEQLTVQDGARIAASTSKESTGQGGSIIIKAEELDVLNNGAINVASEGTEQAGDLEITADSIKLDNQGKLIGQANSGNGGNIKLNLRKLLLLRHNSEISTSSGTQRAGGNGGKITINVPSGFIIAVPSENSDITANAYTGKGGSVRINANGIYGTQFREKENPQTSDITASSDFGLNGNVELNTPDIDPNSGLIELPTTPVDTKVAQGCYSPNYAQSGFLITGRGGLPANPKDILTPDATEIDWVSLKSSHNRSLPPVTNKPTIPTPKRIVEATGAILNANGQVVLTANPPTANFHSPRNIATACRNN